jgi:OOP family OmpA-OmpF porin
MTKIVIKDSTKAAFRKLRNIAILALLAAGLWYGGKSGAGRKILHTVTLGKTSLDNASETPTLTGTAKTKLALPSTKAANLPGNATEIHLSLWAWSTQAGCTYAIGGPVTTKGSLFEKFGLRGTVKRQDDTNEMLTELTATAKDMHDGKEPQGTHFVGIMGDQSAGFLRKLNKQLVKDFGDENTAEIVYSCGSSHGEDQFIGPKSIRDNPKSLAGAVVAAAPYEGDMNIVLYYAMSNGVPINPDFTTYDPDAVNFHAASDYVDAGNKFCTRFSETRDVVKDGKRTGEKREVTVNSVTTWTPVDVTVGECAAKQNRPVVSIVSTREYANQMPHVLIGIKSWNAKHADDVTKMIAAFSIAGNQVLTFPDAQTRAFEVQQTILQEKGYNSDKWKTFYLGTTRVIGGDTLNLGGSKVNNYADNQRTFGLSGGSSPQTSRFHATYTLFGNLVHTLWPKQLDEVPPMESVVNLKYLRAAESLVGEDAGTAEEATYSVADTISHTVSNATVKIEFSLGSAVLTANGRRQLDELFDRLSTNNLMVEVNGFTDALGNAAANETLSQARADAVKSYLEGKDANVFPSGRVRATGYGAARFLDATGKSPANRRVEIRTGQ